MRELRGMGIVLAAILAALPAAAQPRSDSSGVAPARVDSVFDGFDRTNSVGCALGVIGSGRLIHGRGYGMADLERGVPMTTQTLVDIGSVTKQFTAMAVMMLADEGKLSLDDDVRKYIPEVPRYGHTITLRHLIHHTSGLRDYLTLLLLTGLDFADVADDADGLAILARQRALDFSPGEEYSYSNSGYFLLSLVIQRTSGKSFRQFARERFFEPLGMTHTLVHDYVSLVPNRAVGYSRTDSGEVRVELWRFTQTGDGAIFSTIEDLVRWDGNFYTAKVGGPAVMAEMHRTGVLNDGRSITYAGGNNVGRYRGLRRVSHTGGGGGFSSAITRFPDQRFSVIVSCNQDGADAGAKAQAVADLYLAGEYTEPPPPPPERDSSRRADSLVLRSQPAASELAAFSGEYRSDELAVSYRLEVVHDTLVLKVGRQRGRVLTAYGRDTFRAGELRLDFTRDRRGQVTGFILGAGRVRNLGFSRVAVPRGRGM